MSAFKHAHPEDTRIPLQILVNYAVQPAYSAAAVQLVIHASQTTT